MKCFYLLIYHVAWGNCNKSLSIKLQKLQKHAARILTSSSYDANVDDLSVRLDYGAPFVKKMIYLNFVIFFVIY